MRNVVLTACASTFLALLFPAATLAQDKVTYQLDWLPGGDKSPIYICIQEGFCEDAGIEVTIEP